MLRFAIDSGWMREMQDRPEFAASMNDEMAHVRLKRDCIGIFCEERGGFCRCVVRAQAIGLAVVKTEGEGEKWEEGETGFKEMDLRLWVGCCGHL